MIDTGNGMSAEVLAHAFEPFFTTKEVGKGSGLGLAQTHRFALASGGAVCLVSTPGQGTTVSLLLPRTQKTPVVRSTLSHFPRSASCREWQGRCSWSKTMTMLPR